MLPPKTHLLMYQNGKSAAQCRSAQERQILSAFNGPISFLRFINCGLILQFSPLLHLLTSIISSFFHLHEPICFSNLVSERSAALWHPARLNVRRFFFFCCCCYQCPYFSKNLSVCITKRRSGVFLKHNKRKYRLSLSDKVFSPWILSRRVSDGILSFISTLISSRMPRRRHAGQEINLIMECMG